MSTQFDSYELYRQAHLSGQMGAAESVAHVQAGELRTLPDIVAPAHRETLELMSREAEARHAAEPCNGPDGALGREFYDALREVDPRNHPEDWDGLTIRWKNRFVLAAQRLLRQVGRTSQ